MNHYKTDENNTVVNKDSISVNEKSDEWENLSPKKIEKKLNNFSISLESKNESDILIHLNRFSRKSNILKFSANNLFRRQTIFQIFGLISPDSPLNIIRLASKIIYKIYKLDQSFKTTFLQFFTSDTIAFLTTVIDENKNEEISAITKLLVSYCLTSQETFNQFCEIVSIPSLCQIISRGLTEDAINDWIISIFSLLSSFSNHKLNEIDIKEIFAFLNSIPILDYSMSLASIIFHIIKGIIINNNQEDIAVNALMETTMVESLNDVLSHYIQRSKIDSYERKYLLEIENDICEISLNVYSSTNPHVLIIPIPLVITFMRSKDTSLVNNSLMFLSLYMCDCEENFDECWPDFFGNLPQVIQFKSYQIQIHAAEILYTILIKKPDPAIISQLILQHYFVVLFRIFNADGILIRTQILELMKIFLDYACTFPNEGEVKYRYLKMNIVDEEIDSSLKNEFLAGNEDLDKDENQTKFFEILELTIQSMDCFLSQFEQVSLEDCYEAPPNVITMDENADGNEEFNLFDNIDAIDHLFFGSKPNSLL